MELVGEKKVTLREDGIRTVLVRTRRGEKEPMRWKKMGRRRKSGMVETPRQKKRKGKNIGENGGNTDDREDLDNLFLVGERMKKARLTRAKNQGAVTLFELGRRNTRSPVNDPRSPKKGKWGSKPMDDTLNGREVHVQAGAAGCAATEEVDQLFMGPDGIIKSPIKLQALKGPIIAEVERAMQSKKVGTKREVGLSWKKKLEPEMLADSQATQLWGLKKKRELSGEIKASDGGKRGHSLNNEVETKFGSGMNLMSWNC